MTHQLEDSRMPDGRPVEEQPHWRRDFPVDTDRDASVSRRDFAKFMVMTSGVFAVGQLWIGAQNFLRRRRGQPPVVAIAGVEDLPVGGTKVFHYPGEHDPAVLIRTGERTFLAYDQRCTHLACAVIPRLEHNDIYCPCHEGYFDLATGAPKAGPPRRPLPRITLEIRNGTVHATGVELRT